MSQRIAMAANGRLVIPANVRAELGMQNGGNFIARLEDGQLRLDPIPAAVTRAQRLVRQYIPEGAGLVDDLTEDRRRAAESE